MKSLPVPVTDKEIEEMFAAIDKNEDDKLSYKEFKKMVNPHDVPYVPHPHISQLGMKPQTFSTPPEEKQGIFQRLESYFQQSQGSISMYSSSNNLGSTTNLSSSV